MYTQITTTGDIIRDSDGLVVSPCQDYYSPEHQAFIAWSEAGGELVYDDTPVVTVPDEVPMWAARRVLIGAGLMQPILDALAAMPGIEGEYARSDFATAPNIVRASPFIAYAQNLLGMSSEQIDGLFIAAAQLVATS